MSAQEYNPRADVDRATVLIAELVKAKDELDMIEARLKAHALAHPEEQQALEDADREGKQYLAQGTELGVPVVITADSLVQSFLPESVVHQRLMAEFPHDYKRFFARVTRYETMQDDGKKFRAGVRELLGDRAPAFITACLSRNKDGIPKNVIKVDWKRLAPVKQEEAEA